MVPPPAILSYYLFKTLTPLLSCHSQKEEDEVDPPPPPPPPMGWHFLVQNSLGEP